MRRFALKALVAVLAFNRTGRKHIERDQMVLISSTCVTVGLVILYAFGKATSRW
jgi:hypothetical protein